MFAPRRFLLKVVPVVRTATRFGACKQGGGIGRLCAGRGGCRPAHAIDYKSFSTASPLRSTVSRDKRLALSASRTRYFSGSAAQSPFSSEAEYDLAAEDFLEDLNIALESLDEHFPDFDIDYAQGVLTMKLGDEHGTYVLNKQRPNMQIWWSSPTSGPKRFEYEKQTGEWKSSRHGEEMLALLKGELHDINPNIDVKFSDM